MLNTTKKLFMLKAHRVKSSSNNHLSFFSFKPINNNRSHKSKCKLIFNSDVSTVFFNKVYRC